MKKCIKCNIEKELCDFPKSCGGRYYDTECKSCKALYMKERRNRNRDEFNKYMRDLWHSKKDNYYSVYMLPNSGYYVGYTNSVRNRFIQHRSVNNDTSEYIILHKCNTEKEALEYERIYHDIGFPGRHKKTPTKR